VKPVDGRARILVADDDKINRLALRRFLSERHEVIEACDGFEAVAKARVEAPDLVLMDVHMPRLDGAAATARIHGLADAAGRPRPLIVAVTANALEGDSERLLGAGMDGYLSKPVTLSALGGLLAAVAAGRPLPSGRSAPSGVLA